MTNTKAIRKQLVAAIIMVMVAALALGTSTYAWFANNGSVTAKGMAVNASADSSLLIAGSEDGNYVNFSSIGTDAISVDTLKPSTSKDGVTFGKLVSTVKVEKASDAHATGSGTDGAITAADLETATNDSTNNLYYYIDAKYLIKSITTDAKVYVSSITVTSPGKESTDSTTDSSINKALRVAVKIGDTTYVYNPESGNVIDSLVGYYSSSAWSVAAPAYTSVNDATKYWTLTANTAAEAHVYVWYEGQDDACYTNNIGVADMNVTVNFTKVTE